MIASKYSYSGWAKNTSPAAALQAVAGIAGNLVIEFITKPLRAP